MCRFKDMRRYLSFNENTLMATSGDVSDHQMLQRELEAFVAEQTALTTGAPPTPKALANLTSRILYLRRSKMNPYWLSVVVAGVSEKPRGVESQSSQDAQEEVFLGCTDMLGTFFQENFVATGKAFCRGRVRGRCEVGLNRGRVSLLRRSWAVLCNDFNARKVEARLNGRVRKDSLSCILSCTDGGVDGAAFLCR